MRRQRGGARPRAIGWWVGGVGLSLALGAAGAHAQPRWVDGDTDVWVQNLDPAERANVLGDFYTVPGGPPTTILAQEVLEPGLTTTFRSPMAQLGGTLGRFGLIVRSNRRIAAVNRTREPVTGAAVMYNNVDVAESIVVPLVALGFSNPTDVTSIVSVLSTEKNPTLPLDVELFSKTYYRVLVGTTYDYVHHVNQPIPNTTTTRDFGGTWQVDLTAAEYAGEVDEQQPSPAPGEPTGTLGWMRFRPQQIAECATGESPGGVCRVGAESFINLRTVNTAVSGFAGVPESFKSRRLHFPLFRANFFGITGYAIVNPNPAPVRIRTTYFGSDQAPDANCRGQTFTHRAPDGTNEITIPPNENVVLFHIPGNPPPPAPGNVGNSTLPSGCFGSGLVEVTQGDGVIGMGNAFSVDANGLPNTASAYVPFRAEDAAARVAVPMLLHDATRPAGQSLPRVATSVQVMNTNPAGAVSCTATVYEKPPGQLPIPVGVSTAAIGPNRSHTFWSGSFPTVASLVNFEGSAIVACGGPVATIVTLAEFARDSVTYNGIKAD